MVSFLLISSFHTMELMKCTSVTFVSDQTLGADLVCQAVKGMERIRGLINAKDYHHLNGVANRRFHSPNFTLLEQKNSNNDFNS